MTAEQIEATLRRFDVTERKPGEIAKAAAAIAAALKAAESYRRFAERRDRDPDIDIDDGC